MDKKEWWTLHANAEKALTKIPGVMGVGLGARR